MDQLPISIQKIIWEEYIDPDYEDLITKDTTLGDLLIILNVLCIIPRDKFRIVMVAAITNNICIFDYTLSISALSYYEIATVINIAMSHGYLDMSLHIINRYDFIWYPNKKLFINNVREGLLIGFENACKNIHFHVTDWIIADWMTHLGDQTVINRIHVAAENAKRSNSKKIRIKYQNFFNSNPGE